MFKYNFKVLLRNIKKNPVYSTISILGFTFGITASLFIYFWVFDELSFEKFHPDSNRIYRVLNLSKEGDNIIKSAGSCTALASTLKTDYPQIEDATYISYSSETSPLKIEGTTNKIETKQAWVDGNFFNVFQGFRFLEGNKETAFSNPDNIVLTKKTANKIFGTEHAIGKKLINDKYSKEIYTVGAVIEIPPQSHIDFGYLRSGNSAQYSLYNHSWRKSAHEYTYIKLQKNTIIDDEFRKQLSGHLTRYTKRSDKLMFQPIEDIHLHSDYQHFSHDKKIGNYKYVLIFSGLALLIILMASLNFASLSTARASERATEIGVRKVNGSGKKRLIMQFISESIVQTIIATILALILVFALLPWFGNITGKEFSFIFSPRLIGSLITITLSVGLFSGIYPAFYLTSFNPIMIFKGGNPTGSKAGFTQGLVLVQFTIAILLIISTGSVFKQLQYINNHDLGIDKENIIVVPTGLWYSIGSFKQELLENPNVVSVTASTQAPVNSPWQHGFRWDKLDSQDTLQASILFVDEDFAKTYNIKMVKGDFLKFDYSDYWGRLNKSGKNEDKRKSHTISIPVVVNETFVEMMGIEDPIGIRLNKSNVIIGVAKDFHFASLHHKIGPLVMQNNPENILSCSVKIRPENRAETLAFIHNTYKKHRNDREFSYSYFEDELEQVYIAESRLGSLILKFCMLAVVIAMLGIFGLSTFAAERRIKEIGIRKINGAKQTGILALLNKEFLKWVVFAFIIATPTAWFMMSKWLENFAYKTKLNWWIFATAGFVTLIIAILTVSFQAYKAANRNPVEALRYE